MWQALPPPRLPQRFASFTHGSARRGILTGTVPAARLPQWRFVGQRTGRRVASSLRACAHAAVSHLPSVAAAAASRRAPATGHGHGLSRAALLRSHTVRQRLAARAFREDKTQRPRDSRRRTVRSPPAFAAAASRRKARRNSESRKLPSGKPFRIPPRPPPFSNPQCGSSRQSCRAPATTPGVGVAAGPPGRGLCAWIHAPARTPAVLTGCHTPRPHDSKSTIDSKHQCKLPRQLSAEILARAFAPRRATSWLVRIPPASGASGGESRSLGKRITPQKTRLYNFARVSSRGIPLRGSPAGRGLGGSPQTLPTAPVPAFDRHSCPVPHSAGRCLQPVTPTLRILAAAAGRLCHARCPQRPG